MMNFSNFYIKEFVAIPTKGEEEITLSNQKYYKSKKLNEKVKKVIEKLASKDVAIILIKAIDDEMITPLYIDKNIPQYIINQIRDRHRYHAFGRADLIAEKGYIFINPKLLFVDEEKTFKTLVHELIHIAGVKYSKKFENMHNNTYINFYRSFFSNFFEIDGKCINKEILQTFVNRLNIKKNKKLSEIYSDFLTNIKDICNLANNVNFIKYSEELPRFVRVASILFYKRESGFKGIPEKIWKPLRKTYKDALGVELPYYHIQELWIPTEIISIIGTFDPNNESIKKTIKLFKK